MIYPEMCAEELRDLCALAGRPLTNDEAQELLKELTIYRAWEAWIMGNVGYPQSNDVLEPFGKLDIPCVIRRA